ncbi:hypothetical protein N0B44_33615 [Roseibacterium beibuensis]|uniref:hypothetical protein n=1 Tax=[Roseibacterium] beibuensis TaxID=1193142 RepID=UPI00217D6215|nr:hypothetical protein [Roseibacterium beibuensis]MCS6627851.1 hypothetical protein [Roseibacterium beibuensis]
MTDHPTAGHDGRTARIRALFLSLWRERRVTLQSPRSPDQCVAALKHDLAGWPFGGTESVRGRVGRKKAVLARRIPYGNSFRDLVTVRISPLAGQGARLDCVTAASPFVRVFMVIWFGFLGLWWVAVLAIAITQLSLTAVFMALFPIPMLAFGVGLTASCRGLSAKDGEVVLAYLRKRLEAS